MDSVLTLIFWLFLDQCLQLTLTLFSWKFDSFKFRRWIFIRVIVRNISRNRVTEAKYSNIIPNQAIFVVFEFVFSGDIHARTIFMLTWDTSVKCLILILNIWVDIRVVVNRDKLILRAGRCWHVFILTVLAVVSLVQIVFRKSTIDRALCGHVSCGDV